MVEIEDILSKINDIVSRYHRLLLIVGKNSRELTDVLHAVSDRLDTQVVNLSARLAEDLIEEPSRQRQLKAHKVVAAIVEQNDNDVVILDHTDLLFSPTIQIDALALLKFVSRNKTVVAVWLGETDGKRLSHAQDWHPEYQNYSVDDYSVLSMSHEAV